MICAIVSAALLVTMFPGQVTIGPSVSRTVTVKLQLFAFPLVSVAVQVTVLVPLAKVVPLAGLQSTLTPGQLSVAAGAKLTN